MPTKYERVSFILDGYEPLSERLKHVDIKSHDRASRETAIDRAASEAISAVAPVHVDHSAKEVLMTGYTGKLRKVASYDTAPMMPPAEAEEASLFDEVAA